MVFFRTKGASIPVQPPKNEMKSDFPADVLLCVDDATECGPIKLMNAVNNGPTKPKSDQTVGNFEEYRSLGIPFARVHDAAICYSYGGSHVVDISGVFPDFDADPDDPNAYDFHLTDEYLSNIRAAGTEPYYRLGQAIEHWTKKYGVNPPKDFGKWARICEHIVRHYNEGWANGFRWGIRYWEIWNEPDGNKPTVDGRQGPTWTGTAEQFLELYKVTSLHLRKCFGDSIKIGGPGFCWAEAWKDIFIPYCEKEGLPLDFFSWHCYAAHARRFTEACEKARALLDAHGFQKTESHLNEWNYVRGWSAEWVYSIECESGAFDFKGAAFIASVMCQCQHAPLDLLMYYDARIGTGMNGMFDAKTQTPIRGYYPFLAWKRLLECGTEVACSADVKDGVDADQFFTCAAKGKDGHGALLVSRFTDDNNVVETRMVAVRLPAGVVAESVRCHVTDRRKMGTDTPVIPLGNDLVGVKFLPNSFALLEW